MNSFCSYLPSLSSCYNSLKNGISTYTKCKPKSTLNTLKKLNLVNQINTTVSLYIRSGQLPSLTAAAGTLAFVIYKTSETNLPKELRDSITMLSDLSFLYFVYTLVTSLNHVSCSEDEAFCNVSNISLTSLV